MSGKKINIAIIGATGFTGLELVYLLTKHPKVKINYLCATKKLGKNILHYILGLIFIQLVQWFLEKIF